MNKIAINSDYVALWQLQDIEETIQDASPGEMPELYDKLEALSSGLTEAIQKLITADRKRVELEARIHEIGLMQHQARVNLKTSNAVAEWGDIRIAELKAQQEEV